MARKKTKERLGMSVYPPAEVAAPIGQIKTTELTQAIRIAAHLLGQAATEVSGLFSPAEWDTLAAVLADRVIEPEVANPGRLMAELVEVASRFGTGPEADGKPHKGGALADRLAALAYAQAWAVLVAVRFRRDNAERMEDGAHWWELRVRWRVLNQE